VSNAAPKARTSPPQGVVIRSTESGAKRIKVDDLIMPTGHEWAFVDDAGLRAHPPDYGRRLRFTNLLSAEMNAEGTVQFDGWL
jgi:hypothetical protein